jgi:hypothetical protein
MVVETHANETQAQERFSTHEFPSRNNRTISSPALFNSLSASSNGRSDASVQKWRLKLNLWTTFLASVPPGIGDAGPYFSPHP